MEQGEIKTETAVKPSKRGYKVPKGENGHVHIKCRRKGFDSDTGKQLHPDQILKFTPEAFEFNFCDQAIGLGYGFFEALHLPDQKSKALFANLSKSWEDSQKKK